MGAPGSVRSWGALAGGERADIGEVGLPETQVLAEEQLEVLAGEGAREPLSIDLFEAPDVVLGVLVARVVVGQLLAAAARLVIANAVAALPLVLAGSEQHLVLLLATATFGVGVRALGEDDRDTEVVDRDFVGAQL